MSERTASRRRVLVVEDEAYVRDSLVEILRRARLRRERGRRRWRTRSRTSARAPVDVVLSDLRMPGADGLELVRRMQTRGPGRARGRS